MRRFEFESYNLYPYSYSQTDAVCQHITFGFYATRYEIPHIGKSTQQFSKKNSMKNTHIKFPSVRHTRKTHNL